ncbi:MAG: type II toxin-antitoxin system YafQ family toxin [Paludibacteraceae bacterium]|nr:type II toxin-antitoxin system YafQ family toxin [Paludibacteraceae bacterium]
MVSSTDKFPTFSLQNLHISIICCTFAPQRLNHLLRGDYNGYWECHINPDWLLLYEKAIEIRVLSLYRTGSHADIFGKGKKR